MRPNSPYQVPRNFYGEQITSRNAITIANPIGTGSLVPPYGQLAPAAAGAVERRIVPWPGVAARAWIACIPKADYVDGEEVVLTSIDASGLQNPVTFEFDPAGDGAGGGGVAVNISGATDAQSVALIFAGVINAQEALGNINVRASTPVLGVFWVRQTFPGTGGNLAITESVTDVDFLINGTAAGSTTFLGGLNPSALAPCVRGGPVRGVNRSDYGCTQSIWGMNPHWPPNQWCAPEDVPENPA